MTVTIRQRSAFQKISFMGIFFYRINNVHIKGYERTQICFTMSPCAGIILIRFNGYNLSLPG